MYEFAGKAVWDIPLTRRFPLYLSPGLSVGYFGFSGDSSFASKGLTIQAMADLKMTLKDRWVLFLRGVGVDMIYVSDTSATSAFSLWYKLLLGGGVAF